MDMAEVIVLALYLFTGGKGKATGGWKENQESNENKQQIADGRNSKAINKKKISKQIKNNK